MPGRIIVPGLAFDMRIKIPMPPERIFDIGNGLIQFAPDGDFNQFLDDRFLNEGDPLFNPEHVHLTAATIGFLWTNVGNKRRGRRVAGEAEMPERYKGMRAGTWTVAALEYQLTEWFGTVPTFKIVFNAELWRDNDDVGRLALLEHELYHCGQAVDEFGLPKFSKSGLPKFRIRGHDIEEFTSVVRRYGIEATGQDRVDFVAAAAAEPEVSRVAIANLCGTCLV